MRRFRDTDLDQLPASARDRRPIGVLEPFKAYLNARFTQPQGQVSGTRLFHEIYERGYQGSRQVVRKPLAALRAGIAEPVGPTYPALARCGVAEKEEGVEEGIQRADCFGAGCPGGCRGQLHHLAGDRFRSARWGPVDPSAAASGAAAARALMFGDPDARPAAGRRARGCRAEEAPLPAAARLGRRRWVIERTMSETRATTWLFSGLAAALCCYKRFRNLTM